MKILVAVKHVVDPNIKIQVKAAGGVDTTHLKMVMNPFDEIALEEAIRLKEQKKAQEVVAVSIGGPLVQETLRHALALGADRAIFIHTDFLLSPLVVAKLLCALSKQEQPHLVMLGKQAIDSDNNQVGQMLAALLAWPQGTFISKLVVEGEEVKVTREIDGGLETLALRLPAVITTDLRLNTPRYVTLPNIVKAKQKPLATLTPAELGVEITAPRYQTLKIMPPVLRQGGIKVRSAKELIEKLKTEARVL